MPISKNPVRAFIPSGERIPAIDGLRAIAVAGVLLFHLGDRLPGGFFGVDVFLVVSGFVVTKVLLREYRSEGQIRLGRFLARRARRLLPALALVLVFTTVAAWFILSAQSFKQYAGSLVATVFVGSNFFFWQTTDYFAPADQDQPLLHTWSLGLEEQFYLIFPLVLLLFLKKLSRKLIVQLLVVGVLLSFGASVAANSIAPVAAFYLLPFRAWELLVGVLIAMINSPPQWTKRFARLAPIVGLGLITFSFFVPPGQATHPGAVTLLPVIGAGLVIAFASHPGPLQFFLGTKPIVFFGLISYSVYLWHLPISFVLENLRFFQESPMKIFFVVVFTVVLASFSYIFLERSRRGDMGFSRPFLVPVALTSLGLATFGLSGWASDGFAVRGTDSVQLELPVPAQLGLGNSVMVIGDSHGADLVAGLKLLGLDGVVDRTSNGCIGLIGVDRYDYRFRPGDCLEKNRVAFDEFLHEADLRTLVILNMGPVYFGEATIGNREDPRQIGQRVTSAANPTLVDPYSVVEIGLNDTFSELAGLRGKNVVYVLDWPELGISNGCRAPQAKEVRIFGKPVLEDILARESVPAEECFTSYRGFRESTQRYSDLVTEAASGFPQVEVFDMSRFFCDSEKCLGFREGFGFLYRDFDHLSAPAGVLFAANKMVSDLPHLFE